ncbi:hypothetical protein DCC81_03395 [Chitinophaga parva]|uniref:Uncharacterized protein n=1 Tax=Chitinophaga parva TaxID=2169414 RepID=A0A2T7BLL8_9BACT|nr:hypothetical protein [Chitinophaga parva]PUZ28539.1 hypothetical protein DCC81_03395 [Chitinophaga parva]
MENAINLKMLGRKIKVVSFKHPEFLERAHELHGTFREPAAWYFDDIYLDEVRAILMKLWRVTGERAYEECTLYVRNFSAEVEQGPVYLFNRLIAQSYGHGKRSQLGEGINVIFGRYRVGGSMRHWRTDVIDMTMEIERFPFAATAMPEVQQAIAAGQCVVEREGADRTPEIIQVEIEKCTFNLNKLNRELLIRREIKPLVA